MSSREQLRPIGFPLPDWNPPPRPSHEAMVGRYCRLEPLDPDRHSEPLFNEFTRDPDGAIWTYLAYGPFPNAEAYRHWMNENCRSEDPLFFAICRASDGGPAGMASYLRVIPTSGSIEVGHIVLAPTLQRTPAATEAMYLMMQRAFEVGYRRYEWKCDALNAASRAAAERLGFKFEGIFRQATVYKGRNRDTAWYSILNMEWPALRVAFEAWLDPANFDESGHQRSCLSDLTRLCSA